MSRNRGAVPPFYIGQKVEAISTHTQGVFSKGDQFPVTGIRPGCCKKCKWEISIGIELPTLFSECEYCGTVIPENGLGFFNHLLFIPVDQTFVPITFKNVIKNEQALINGN